MAHKKKEHYHETNRLGPNARYCHLRTLRMLGIARRDKPGLPVLGPSQRQSPSPALVERGSGRSGARRPRPGIIHRQQPQPSGRSGTLATRRRPATRPVLRNWINPGRNRRHGSLACCRIRQPVLRH